MVSIGIASLIMAASQLRLSLCQRESFSIRSGISCTRRECLVFTKIKRQANIPHHTRSFLEALVFPGSGGPNNSPLVINPARHDPRKVKASTFPGSNSRVVAFPSTYSPVRAVNFIIGINICSNVIHAVHFAGDKSGQNRQIKQIILLPIRGEFERAVAFYGTVFGQNSLAVGTFGVRQNDSDRLSGITIRTMPAALDGGASTREYIFIHVTNWY